MNVAVVNIKDILKYLVKAIIILSIIISFTRYFALPNVQKTSGELKENIEESTKKISKYSYTYCLDLSLPDLINNRGEEKESVEENIGQKILGMELNLINSIKPKDSTALELAQEGLVSNEEGNIELAEKNLQTETVTEKNMNAAYTNTYGTVKIRNKSDYSLTEDILVPDVEVNKNKILIVHTHTCESYTPTEANPYEATGNYRTTDLNKSVARVGTVLQKQLSEYGYQVIHDTTYHDYPAYTGSYERSEKTIRSILEQNDDIQIVFDIHRDAVRKRNRIWTKSKNRGRIRSTTYVCNRNRSRGAKPS